MRKFPLLLVDLISYLVPGNPPYKWGFSLILLPILPPGFALDQTSSMTGPWPAGLQGLRLLCAITLWPADGPQPSQTCLTYFTGSSQPGSDAVLSPFDR